MFRQSSERFGSAFTLVAFSLIALALPHPAQAHREHNARHARFMQRDPVSEWGPPAGLLLAESNSYAYTKSNPMTYVDSEGLKAVANPNGGGGLIALTHYGKYCGPFNPSTELPTNNNCPDDCLDSACCFHDDCYDNPDALSIALHLLGLKFDPNKRTCDREFCKRAQCALFRSGGNYSLHGYLYGGGIFGVFRCYERYPLVMLFGHCSKYKCENIPPEGVQTDPPSHCRWPCGNMSPLE